MTVQTLKIKRLTATAILPTRATTGSAGYDLYADLTEDITIQPGQVQKIGTGIAIGLEDTGCAAFLYARSGLATRSRLIPANCVGVVDSDYRGEILIPLANLGSEPVTVCAGDRIAQMVIAPVFTPTLQEVENLPPTKRGDGGFGSTGR